MEIFPIYIMSLYRMSDKDLKKRIRISDVVFKDLEESLMIFGESSKIVVDSPKISIESITSSRYLWPRVRTAGVLPGRDCSHCHIHERGPGSRSTTPRHSLRQSYSSPSICHRFHEIISAIFLIWDLVGVLQNFSS